MPSFKRLAAVALGALLLTACATKAMLSEATREEADALKSRVGPGNPGLGLRDVQGGTPDTFWIQVHVAAGILANDKGVEKFEEGALKAQLPSGENIDGNYLGYRPRTVEHCTRSWLFNFYHFDSRGAVFGRAGGVAVLKGDQGTALLCAYDWLGPGCQRQGVCGAKDGKYYMLQF